MCRTRLTLKKAGVTLDLVPPPSKVNNLIFGRTWVDSPGEMILTNLTTGDKVVLYFQPCGWLGYEPMTITYILCWFCCVLFYVCEKIITGAYWLLINVAVIPINILVSFKFVFCLQRGSLWSGWVCVQCCWRAQNIDDWEMEWGNELSTLRLRRGTPSRHWNERG